MRKFTKTTATATATVLAIAVMSSILFASSHAATGTNSFEPEAGVLSGSAVIGSDNSASNGSYISFGAASSSAGSTVYGTLASLPEHAAYESQHGVKMAMLELGWDAYEPADGQFSSGYAASMKAKLATFQQNGLQVTLALGMHNPPAWLYDIADSRYLNQNNQQSSDVDLVFNQLLRLKAETYLAQINKDLGLNNFSAIRLTSGGNAEMLYPPNNSYWAFDNNAQNGPNMPSTMSKNPLPGWKPGTRSVTTAQVRTWGDWYIGGLVDVTNWQVATFNRLGYTGMYQLLTPGSGTRPDGYESDIDNYLPNGVTGVGAVWQKYYAMLPLQIRNRSTVYVSSVADHSGNDDSCTTNDGSVAVTSSTMDSWSAIRYQARLAKEYGMSVGGENPGWNQPSSFNDWYKNVSSTGMMATAMRQVKSCNLSNYYWAHDDKLWDGTVPFDTYANYVSQNNK